MIYLIIHQNCHQKFIYYLFHSISKHQDFNFQFNQNFIQNYFVHFKVVDHLPLNHQNYFSINFNFKEVGIIQLFLFNLNYLIQQIMLKHLILIIFIINHVLIIMVIMVLIKYFNFMVMEQMNLNFIEYFIQNYKQNKDWDN